MTLSSALSHIQEIEQRLKRLTHYRHAVVYLLQNLIPALQRGNAASVLAMEPMAKSLKGVCYS